MNRRFDSISLVRSFFSISGLYLLSIPLLLLANIVLARTLSVADFGRFGFALSLATVLSIPVSGGLPMLLTREIAGYVQKDNWSAYRGLVKIAYRWVMVTCLAIGLIFSVWMVFSSGQSKQQFLVILLIVPFLGLSAIRNGILKGLGRPVLAEAPAQVVQPALMILGYIILAYLGLASAIHALWWYFAVIMMVFGLASIMLWRVQPVSVGSGGADTADLPRWRRAILPFIMMSAATVLSTQTAILILGFSGQEEAVAQMRVAERGAQLVAFPLAFINSIIGPYFVQALETGEKSALHHIARQSARLTFAASLPVAITLLVFGETLISWTFGAPYDVESYSLMAILIMAQIISVMLGNGGMLLAMGGHERQAVYGHVVSLTIILLVGGLLIIPFGATGAAIGAGAGTVAAKIYFYVVVRRTYSFFPGFF